LARSAYYTESVNWLLRDAEVMAALGRLVEERLSRGFWK
jgi:putative transposase